MLWSEKIYIVPRNDERILVGATVECAGFDKRVTAGGIERILSAALELAPGLKNARIEETWAGLRPDSQDHLPILGPTDVDGLLMATGHFRSGIFLTPITARLMREWITGQRVSVDGNGSVCCGFRMKRQLPRSAPLPEIYGFTFSCSSLILRP